MVQCLCCLNNWLIDKKDMDTLTSTVSYGLSIENRGGCNATMSGLDNIIVIEGN